MNNLVTRGLGGGNLVTAGLGFSGDFTGSNQPPTRSSVNYGESVSEQHGVQSSQHKGVGSVSVRGKEIRKF